VTQTGCTAEWLGHRSFIDFRIIDLSRCFPVLIDSADQECSAKCKCPGAVGRTADVRSSDHLQHKRQHDEHDVRPQVVADTAVAVGDRRQQSAETLPRLQQAERPMFDIPRRARTAHESNSVTASLQLIRFCAVQ